jgi:CRP-like cAMP-binding protein
VATKCDPGLLAAVPLFSGLTAKELRGVSSVAKRMHFADGEVVVEEGTTGGRFYVVQSGTAKVVQRGRTRVTLGPGAYFGELAVIDGGARTASVVATSPLEVWAIADFNFRPLLKEHPALAAKLLAALARRLRNAERSLVT